jgi:chemotaxis protein CheD
MTAVADKITHVGMGNIGAAQGAAQFRAILGSCIGLSFYDRALKAGAFAHVVLPNSHGRSGPPGKFADTAVAEMIRLMKKFGSSPAAIRAKMSGGANLLAREGPLKIGDDNAEALKAALQAAGIRLVAQETGGTKGRRVLFDCQNGDYLVEIAGNTPQNI